MKNYTQSLFLLICLVPAIAQGESQPVALKAPVAKPAPLEVKRSESIIPRSLMPSFLISWLQERKNLKIVPLIPAYEIEGLVGTYPPKIYWIIQQLQQQDSPLLANRLILYGPPGNGKTSLAKAIAKEAGCLFMHALDGASVVTPYLGAGAENIEKNFNEAIEAYERTGKRVVLFMDEIDAICRRKNYESVARTEHQVATQKLWLCLDKYKYHPGIFFICATNHFKELDLTFLDRFSNNTIEIKNPDAASRKSILEYYSAKHNISFEGDLLQDIIKKTNNLSNRSLENFVKSIAEASKMFGPSQVTEDTIWQLLTHAKKKFVENKSSDLFEASKFDKISQTVSFAHNVFSLAHNIVTLPMLVDQLRTFMTKSRTTSSFIFDASSAASSAPTEVWA